MSLEKESAVAVPSQPWRNNPVRIHTNLDTLIYEALLRDLMALGAQDLLMLFLSTGMPLLALSTTRSRRRTQMDEPSGQDACGGSGHGHCFARGHLTSDASSNFRLAD